MINKMGAPAPLSDITQAWGDPKVAREIKYRELPVIEAGTVGSKASLTWLPDENGNLVVTETDDDGNIIR